MRSQQEPNNTYIKFSILIKKIIHIAKTKDHYSYEQWTTVLRDVYSTRYVNFEYAFGRFLK